MRKDDLAYMPKTLSLLGDTGMTFSNAYVSNPLCCPSRTNEQGLREANREQRGVHLRGDESYDGKEIGLLMSCSDRFRRVILRTSAEGSRTFA